MTRYLIFSLLFLLCSCGNDNKGTRNQPSSDYGRSNYSSNPDNDEDEEVSNDDEENIDGEIEDGTHSATVQYYNPETGHMATYTLDVEVEDGEVRQINFPKGGWLDETHISPEELEDGRATLRDEEGREYEVEIDDN